MAFWKKKKEEELDFPPEEGEIPSLPPLPGEEDLTAPPPLPREARMRPASPVIPEVSMEAPRPRMPPMSATPTVADKTTVFVRIDKYRDIMRTIEAMQAKIDELNTTLSRISTIKQRESEIIDGWHAMLSDAKGKLDEISSKMTKPEA